MNILTRLLTPLTLVLTSVSAFAQINSKLYTRTEGELVRAALAIEIEHDWHLYHTELGNELAVGKPTKLSFEGDGIQWSEPRFPEPEQLLQLGMGANGSDGWINGHHGSIVVYGVGRADSGEAEGEEFSWKISGLTCQDNGSCIPYRETLTSLGEGADKLFANFPTDMKIAGELIGAAGKPAMTSPASSNDVEAGPEGDWTVGNDAIRFRMYHREIDGIVRVVVEASMETSPEWHLYHTDLGPEAEGAAAKPMTIDFMGEDLDWGDFLLPEPELVEQAGMALDGGSLWVLAHHGDFRIYSAADNFGAEPEPSMKIKGLTCDVSCIPLSATVTSSGAGPDELFEDFPESVLASLSIEGTPYDATAGGDSSGSNGVVDAGNARGTEGGSNASVDAQSLNWPYTAREVGVGGAEGAEGGEAGAPRGLGVWLFLAFIAGLILNVMPCVLPVVSIKILSFVNQAGESRGRIFALGLAFSAGILSVFVALGAFAAGASNFNWGQQFQDTTFLVIMTAVVFGFSLSLFGVYELGVPSKVGQIAGHQQRKEGLMGAFSMGVLSTVLATPCSGPFLGSTLAWALSQPKAVIFGIFGMAGVGMAAPYVILTANPAFLKFVPKPGAWMETFKHISGFLLLFTALVLMVSIPQDKLLLTVTFLLFVAIACWIWGHYATFDQKFAKRIATLAWVLVAVLGGWWMSFRGLPGFFAEGELWEPFDRDKLVAYQAEGRNVFVDFTADWCLTCKANEKAVYENEDVVNLFKDKDVVVMKADETEEDEVIISLRNHLGARSIPFSAIFPGNEPNRPYTLKDVVLKDQFIELLETLPE